jgi:arylsulfatase
VDILSTALDLAGTVYPPEKTPLEGRSFTPLLKNGSIEREALYWEHEGNRAVRAGDWKLVAMHNRAWELYDLATDRAELKDLSREQPERVKAMNAMWNAYAARALVEPWDRIQGDRKKQ